MAFKVTGLQYNMVSLCVKEPWTIVQSKAQDQRSEFRGEKVGVCIETCKLKAVGGRKGDRPVAPTSRL
jgi:hypothetical protein